MAGGEGEGLVQKIMNMSENHHLASPHPLRHDQDHLKVVVESSYRFPTNPPYES